MGAALAVLPIAGALLGAVGSIQKGIAADKQAEFNATIARNNAIISQRKAEDARSRGQAEERRNQIKTLQLLGQQRAAAAASGVVVDAGSALDLTADTAAFGRLDDLTIRNNAEREALGFEAQAANFNTSAQAFEAAGQSARTAGFIGAGSSLLSGAAAVDPKWLQFGQKSALSTETVQGFGTPNPPSSQRSGNPFA